MAGTRVVRPGNMTVCGALQRPTFEGFGVMLRGCLKKGRRPNRFSTPISRAVLFRVLHQPDFQMQAFFLTAGVSYYCFDFQDYRYAFPSIQVGVMHMTGSLAVKTCTIVCMAGGGAPRSLRVSYCGYVVLLATLDK